MFQNMSYRFTLHYMQLPMEFSLHKFWVIITDIWWDIWNSYMTWGWFAFFWISTIFFKSLEGRVSSPSSFFDMIHSPILQNNTDHSSKLDPLPFFHSDTNHVLDHVLVSSVDKSHVLFITVELIWFLFLNILSSLPNKSLRFKRFRRSYANYSGILATNHYQSCTASFCCLKWPRSFSAAVCPQW